MLARLKLKSLITQHKIMNYTLTFTEQQLLILNQALQELPFKIAAPLFESINKQIKELESNPTED